MTSNPPQSSYLPNTPHESELVSEELPLSTSLRESSSSDDENDRDRDQRNEIDLERAHMKDIPIMNMRLHINLLHHRK
ncbi:hypothetical protein FDP41_006172 [Naegleria fowleri]|uniref:Uncharacterized protein n=1 Tax=Naegleria fowleri TaxID=5763 RepID=A0A6A5BKL3_NAEFO|nr:uncharacterized protein FDP41_006172 [Naegleria fowleri]KAF0974698.1 hypothetical protein FDP41_006172 [Naegleria fowleri]